MLIHTHIPKTGGTTLNHILKAAFGCRYRQLEPALNPTHFEDLVPDRGTVYRLDNLRPYRHNACLSSHWLFVEDTPATYMLCYRDPIKRMISDFAHKAELLGEVPDFEEFATPRMSLQYDYMCGLVGEVKFKTMVREGTVLAVRTESLSEDLRALGVSRSDERRNVARGRRFYEQCATILHDTISRADMSEDNAIVEWLDEHRHDGYREMLPVQKKARFYRAEFRRKMGF